jgi:hypothetical protein
MPSCLSSDLYPTACPRVHSFLFLVLGNASLIVWNGKKEGGTHQDLPCNSNQLLSSKARHAPPSSPPPTQHVDRLGAHHRVIQFVAACSHMLVAHIVEHLSHCLKEREEGVTYQDPPCNSNQLLSGKARHTPPSPHPQQTCAYSRCPTCQPYNRRTIWPP